MVELTERELGYLEGILDGEGTVTLCRQKRKRNWGDRSYLKNYCYAPLVSVANTNTKILQYIKDLLGGGTISPSKALARQRPKSKILYKYIMTRPLMREILPQLELVAKETQRLMLIDALEILKRRVHERRYGTEMLEAIYQEMKRLHKRGRNKEGGGA